MGLCILHVCGGDPIKQTFIFTNHVVFSTYVEVILKFVTVVLWRDRILHVCGGDPHRMLHFHYHEQYSPRMWRWSLPLKSSPISITIFSTHVEVILQSFYLVMIKTGILHTCGGDPFSTSLIVFTYLYSPHMWRWSLIFIRHSQFLLVFSTHVEVIPI